MSNTTLRTAGLALLLIACRSTIGEPEQQPAPTERVEASSANTEAQERVVASPLYRGSKMIDIARGHTSAITEARTFVAQDAEHWAELWRAHCANLLPRPEVPEVDFEQWMVVGVIVGERRSGGYGVEIVGCTAKEGGLLVEAIETRPTPGQPATMALTSPFHFVRMPRATGGVEFRLSVAPAQR